MLSSVRSVHTMLNNASSTPSAGRGGGDVDRDSDEEEELPPPPPPIEVEAILTTPPKGSMFQHFQQQQQVRMIIFRLEDFPFFF